MEQNLMNKINHLEECNQDNHLNLIMKSNN